MSIGINPDALRSSCDNLFILKHDTPIAGCQRSCWPKLQAPSAEVFPGAHLKKVLEPE